MGANVTRYRLRGNIRGCLTVVLLQSAALRCCADGEAGRFVEGNHLDSRGHSHIRSTPFPFQKCISGDVSRWQKLYASGTMQPPNKL